MLIVLLGEGGGLGGIRLTEGKKATWYLMWHGEESWTWQTLGDLATDTVIPLPLYSYMFSLST